MGYHRFPAMAEDDNEYGSFEVFYVNVREARRLIVDDGWDEATISGWYWWACFPGCLPDGDASGPFNTEAEAIADAREES